MAVAGFHFVLRPDPMNDLCVFCVEPTMSWSIRAEVQDHHVAVPIETVCADCVGKLVDIALERQSPQDRLATAKRLKLSATKAIELPEPIDATARRLLS